MTTDTLIDKTTRTVRRTRRAYIGALGLGYDFVVARAEKRSEQIASLFESAVERGEDIEADAREFMNRAKAEARDLTTDIVGDLEETVEDAAETVQDLKEEIVLKAKKAEKRAELAEKVEESDKYASYVEKVRAYDKAADPVVVKAIVDHLGSSLSNRDTMFVACSDESERKTVARNWLGKKLGVEGDAKAMDAKVSAICETMKGDRLKDRVVFYYLAAKAEGKLAVL